MKKILVFLLTGFVLLTFAACKNTDSGQQGGSDTVTQTEGNTLDTGAAADTASSGDVKIAIEPPSGWTAVEGSVLPVQYMNNTASFMVKEETLFQSKTLDGVINEAKGIFEKTFSGMTYEGETKKITVDGKDATQFQFICAISGVKMKFEYVYLFVNDKVYAITFGDMADTFDSLSGDYEQILKDIRFQS